MILSDASIRELIDSGKIVILPEFDTRNIRPVGIRLHLGKDLLIPQPGQTIDPGEAGEMRYDTVEIGDGGFILKPDQFVLGTTYEKFQVPRDIVCHIDGRSTVARLGLSIHCTSGIIDGNFNEPRTVVLEIKNIGPTNLVLKNKLAIAMLTFTNLSTPILQETQDQYRGQEGVIAPNLKVQKR